MIMTKKSTISRVCAFLRIWDPKQRCLVNFLNFDVITFVFLNLFVYSPRASVTPGIASAFISPQSFYSFLFQGRCISIVSVGMYVSISRQPFSICFSLHDDVGYFGLDPMIHLCCQSPQDFDVPFFSVAVCIQQRERGKRRTPGAPTDIPGSVMVPQRTSFKITVSVWVTIQKFLENTVWYLIHV